MHPGEPSLGPTTHTPWRLCRQSHHRSGQTGSGTYVKLREVSEQMAIPAGYTQEILTLLMRAGLAEARPGKHGGPA